MARTSRSRSPSTHDRTLVIRTRDFTSMARTSRSRSPPTHDRTLAIRTRDFTSMARTSRSRSPPTRNRTLAIRTRDPLPQNATVTPFVSESVSTQADRCPFPGCLNTLPHQHSPAEGEIAPSIEEYKKAAEAIRERWYEQQRRHIAENEALSRELAEIERKVNRLSVKLVPELNDQSETSIIDEIPSDLLILSHDRRNGTSLFYETTSFPELDRQNETASRPHQMPISDRKWTLCFKNGNPISQQPLYLYLYRLSEPPPCTGTCPIQTPHIKGPYLQRGGVPRVWNPRWGFSDPPRAVWEAWLRIRNGRARSWDRVQVDGFSKSHAWWGEGPMWWG